MDRSSRAGTVLAKPWCLIADTESAIEFRHRSTGPHRKMDQRWPSASGNNFDSMGSADIPSGSGLGKKKLAAESGTERKGRIDIQRKGAVRRGQQNVCV